MKVSRVGGLLSNSATQPATQVRSQLESLGEAKAHRCEAAQFIRARVRIGLSTTDLADEVGVSLHSLIRRVVERGRTTESSARRANQRLAVIDDPLADPTSGYLEETPSRLKKTADLSGNHGADVLVLADALKLSPTQVRDPLGDANKRPVLRLVGDEG